MAGRCTIAYKVTLITGGHSAGKTSHALRLAEGYAQRVYIATAEAIDDEMESKIARHRAQRGESYTTVEAPLHLGEAVVNAPEADVLIIDCLTVWVNNLIYYDQAPYAAFAGLYNAIKQARLDIIMVSNESSMGLIGGDRQSRLYTGLLAELNNAAAALADEVLLMVSGIAVKIKG